MLWLCLKETPRALGAVSGITDSPLELCFGVPFLQASLSRDAACTTLRQSSHGSVLHGRPFQRFTKLDVNLG